MRAITLHRHDAEPPHLLIVTLDASEDEEAVLRQIGPATVARILDGQDWEWTPTAQVAVAFTFPSVPEPTDEDADAVFPTAGEWLQRQRIEARALIEQALSVPSAERSLQDPPKQATGIGGDL